MYIYICINPHIHQNIPVTSATESSASSTSLSWTFSNVSSLRNSLCKMTIKLTAHKLYTYVCIHIYIKHSSIHSFLKIEILKCHRATKFASYRVAKTHRMPEVALHFPQKSH